MAAQFIPAWSFLMELEGGGQLHKLRGDPGGWTIWGISQKNHPGMFQNGPPTEEQARRFYEATYWLPLRLNELQDQGIAEEIFEFAVNSSTPVRGQYNLATRAAQRAVNAVFTVMAWDPIRPDGVMGPKTIRALNDIGDEGPVALLAWDGAFNIEQLRYYRELNPAQVQRFLLGWTRRIVL